MEQKVDDDETEEISQHHLQRRQTIRDLWGKLRYVLQLPPLQGAGRAIILEPQPQQIHREQHLFQLKEVPHLVSSFCVLGKASMAWREKILSNFVFLGSVSVTFVSGHKARKI